VIELAAAPIAERVRKAHARARRCFSTLAGYRAQLHLARLPLTPRFARPLVGSDDAGDRDAGRISGACASRGRLPGGVLACSLGTLLCVG
jgi:hypothetical protein